MFSSRVRKRIRRSLAMVVCVMLACLCYLDRVGVPNWLNRRLTRELSRGNIAIETHRIRCHVLRSLDIVGLELYRRGQIGQAFLRAGHVEVALDPLAFVNSTRLLQQVRMENVTILPALIGRTATSDPATPAVNLNLGIELHDVMLDEIHIKQLTGHLHNDETGFSLANLEASLIDDEGGIVLIHGHISYDLAGAVYSASLTVDGDPNLMVEPLRAWGMRVAPEIISRFTFTDTAPRFVVNFHHKAEGDGTWFVDGRVWIEEGSYRSVEFMRADGTYNFQVGKSNLVFQVDPLLIVRSEGLARGHFVYASEPERQTLGFTVSSTLDPHALAGMVGVLTNVVSPDYIFDVPYRVEAYGVYDFLAPEKTVLSADIDLGGIQVGEIDLLQPSFSWKRTGYVSEFPEFRAQFCGGIITGKGYLAKPTGAEVTSAFFTGDWRGIGLKGFADRMIGDGKHGFSGDVSGHLHLIGVTGKENRHSWAGNGDMRIVDGQILRMPVFGGLTDYLGKVLPGVDLVVNQTAAHATYRIGNGEVRFDEVRVEGDVLSLLGNGACDFDQELDFSIELTFFKAHTMVGKLIRLPTWIFSKLLEFRVTGPLNSPHWYPVNFSKDIWGRLGLKNDKDKSRLPENTEEGE